MYKLLLCTLVLAMTFSGNNALAAHNNKAVLMMHNNTGQILYQKNAYQLRYPASLTKVMTAYLVFDHLKKGHIKLSDKIKVSAHASSQVPCKIGLVTGQTIALSKLLESLVIISANDSAVAIAEHIAGSEEKFAVLMNEKARQLGMKHTSFKNASGLHHAQHRTTAYDMIKLTMAIYENFPQYIKIFSQTSMRYKGKRYPGSNIVTLVYDDAYGVKTGYTQKAGHCLITAASRHNQKITAVIMGEESKQSRDIKMIQMISKGFNKLNTPYHSIIHPAPELKHKKKKTAHGTQKKQTTNVKIIAPDKSAWRTNPKNKEGTDA